MVVVYVGLCWFIVVLYWFMASIMYCRAYEWNAFTYFLLFDLFWWVTKFCLEANLFCQDTSKTPAVSSREAIEACWGLVSHPGGSPMPSSNDSRWPCSYTAEIRPSRVELATSGNPYPTSKSSRAGTGGSFLSWDFSTFPSIWRMVRYRKKTYIKPIYPVVS